MCGIAGFWGAPLPDARAVASAMAAQLVHRGPDEGGVWIDPGAGLGFAHRRLSVLELSPAGAQPMVSACGRYVLAYNGEIYNHVSLRDDLQRCGAAPAWRGHSDSETLLAALAHWGVAPTLEKLNGMFAFALWDRHGRTLALARDRLGEKPLYYGWSGGGLLFGSELKALRAHPRFAGKVDRAALTLYMRYCYVPAPHCIYEGLAKLPAGHWLQLSCPAAAAGERPQAYWSAGKVVADARSQPFEGTRHEAVDALESLLGDAVRRRMAADVPLGALLSGGYDSTAIVALMQAHSARPVHTFTIGNTAAAYDEAQHAAAVARHLGTDHTELYVTAEDAQAVIPQLPAMYDEPFADSSQIPTFLVSRLARGQVTVALSGDGGDELFAGYNRHVLGRALWQRIGRWPRALRSIVGSGLLGIPPAGWSALLRPLGRWLPGELRGELAGERVHRAAGLLAVQSADDLYLKLVSRGFEAGDVVRATTAYEPLLRHPDAPADLAERMMFMDLIGYLPDDILVKVDRASMAVGLEARVPMLDPRVVELAWQLPLDYKLHQGRSKWVLREVVHRHVPKDLMERPKQGFGVPIERWLRGPLRDWAEHLLAEERLREQGYFDAAIVRRVWREHLGGRHDWHFRLWSVLMFQAWLEAA